MKHKTIFGKIKNINMSQYLKKHYGGNWKYDGKASWQCDDGKRHFSRVAGCSCDDCCNHRPCYYIYFGDKSPKQVFLG